MDTEAKHIYFKHLVSETNELAAALMVLNQAIEKKVNLAMATKTAAEHAYIRYVQRTHRNNWLKIHGYPMRRRTK